MATWGRSCLQTSNVFFFVVVSMLETRVARHPLADIDVGVAEGTVGDAGTLVEEAELEVLPPQKPPKTQE